MVGRDAARRLAAIFALLLALALGGCGELDHYETRDGGPTRLDGSEVDVDALTVAQAQGRRDREPVYVEGYVFAPSDEPSRLCTRLSERGCDGPALPIDMSQLDLAGDRGRALEHGCCAIGAWSPRPVVLRVWLRDGLPAFVLG